jgi:uncharacterized membrane protein
MRSWRELTIIAGACLLAACGNDIGTEPVVPDDDDPDPLPVSKCETSFLDHDNFGAPFVANWCRGCHSSAVPMNMRQEAPIDVNFDGEGDLVHWAERIKIRASGDRPTMPPAGGPGAEERALLAEWIECGTK